MNYFLYDAGYCRHNICCGVARAGVSVKAEDAEQRSAHTKTITRPGSVMANTPEESLENQQRPATSHARLSAGGRYSSARLELMINLKFVKRTEEFVPSCGNHQLYPRRGRWPAPGSTKPGAARPDLAGFMTRVAGCSRALLGDTNTALPVYL